MFKAYIQGAVIRNNCHSINYVMKTHYRDNDSKENKIKLLVFTNSYGEVRQHEYGTEDSSTLKLPERTPMGLRKLLSSLQCRGQCG